MPVATTVPSPPAATTTPRVAPRRTRVWALAEARWAAAATLAFLVALPLQLADAPAWTWGPLYAVAYAAGGWNRPWPDCGRSPSGRSTSTC